MITYVGLMSFAEVGVQMVKITTKRAAAAKEEGQCEPSRVADCRKVRRNNDRTEVTS